MYWQSILIVLLFLTYGNVTGQSSVSVKLKGFKYPEETKLLISKYNGYGYTAYDTVLANTEGTFSSSKKFPTGFYQLNVPPQRIFGLFYCDGKNEVEITVSNAYYQADQVQFNDSENQSLSELLGASKHLEITLNTLLEQFDPRQLDSMYFAKIGPYNLKVQSAYREFNNEIIKLKQKYPETVVMSLFSSFYQIPLFDEDEKYGHFYDNQDAYMRDHFFDLWKLNDPRVIHLPEIKAKLEKYFRYFARRDYSFLIKACDKILGLTNNGQVRRYLASLMINFFSGVKENDVVAYIIENSLGGCLDGIDKNLINISNRNLRGMKVSDISLPGEDQQYVSLAGVYSSATVTILYFWTPECIHCREFHPYVKRLKDKYGDKLGVYRVCLEDDEKKWHDASREFSLNLNNTIASGSARKEVDQTFDITYTPKVYILNASGEILDKGLTGEELEKTIRAYF